MKSKPGDAALWQRASSKHKGEVKLKRLEAIPCRCRWIFFNVRTIFFREYHNERNILKNITEILKIRKMITEF